MNQKGTATDLARCLNGREYGQEINSIEINLAKINRLVVVFGASDDLIEFRGAIEAETGETAYILNGELLENDCDSDDCPHFEKTKRLAKVINRSCVGGKWIFETELDCKRFTVMDDGEVYGEGLVFDT